MDVVTNYEKRSCKANVRKGTSAVIRQGGTTSS